MNETIDSVTPAALLRLQALDGEDLAVMSAYLQGAAMRVGDMVHQPKPRRFALAGSRFDWPLARTGLNQRCGVGLHFDSVRRVMRVGFDQDPARVLDLQAIVFLPGEPPSGTVILSFIGDAAIRLDVECLEASLRDIGPRWSVDAPPDLSR